MPIFMDRHDGVDATPEAMAEGHLRDLAVQAKYGVEYRTYWFDRAAGTVFCLMEGPDRESVDAVHREAHDASASAIIELPSGLKLEDLFGALPEHSEHRAAITPATRAIVFTDICGSVAQVQHLGDDGHVALLREHDRIVRYALAVHGGREVKHTGDGIMAAFTSVAAAVGFAVEVQRAVFAQNAGAVTPLDVSIGISAGEPVTDESDDLFGAAVQLAARLCDAAAAGDILASLVVRELCVGKSFEFHDHGPVSLKGWREPVPSYAVNWR